MNSSGRDARDHKSSDQRPASTSPAWRTTIAELQALPSRVRTRWPRPGSGCGQSEGDAGGAVVRTSRASAGAPRPCASRRSRSATATRRASRRNRCAIRRHASAIPPQAGDATGRGSDGPPAPSFRPGVAGGIAGRIEPSGEQACELADRLLGQRCRPLSQRDSVAWVTPNSSAAWLCLTPRRRRQRRKARPIVVHGATAPA